jgi:hypothetical protein
MLYHVSRNGQTYGPYTLEDLRKYVASGNVLPTDLARSESMSEWLPVSQILGGATSAFGQPPVVSPGATYPGAAYPGTAYPAVGAYPDPPNLHWGLVLLIGFFTCGIFFFVWMIVQAVWMRKVVPQSKALFYYIAYLVLSVIGNVVRGAVYASMAWRNNYAGFGVPPPGVGLGFAVFGLLFAVGILVLIELAYFDMKRSMEQHYNTAEPIGLSLSPVMTFFFGIFYFQYHFTRINEMKRMARYGAPPLR